MTKKKTKPKRRTVQVPDGEGWSRTVEVPDDEPPRRYSQNVQDMNAYMLKHELGQLKIDFECGPGPTPRQRLEAREKDIHRELARRDALADDVMAREVAMRPRAWDGMAPCGKHGADFKGQQCSICPHLVVRLFDNETEVCTPLGQQVSMHVHRVAKEALAFLQDQDPDASLRDFEQLFVQSVQMEVARAIVLRRRPR